MLNIKKLRQGAKPLELPKCETDELCKKIKDDNKRSDILICTKTKERFTPDRDKMLKVFLAYGVRDKAVGYN